MIDNEEAEVGLKVSSEFHFDINFDLTWQKMRKLKLDLIQVHATKYKNRNFFRFFISVLYCYSPCRSKAHAAEHMPFHAEIGIADFIVSGFRVPL